MNKVQTQQDADTSEDAAPVNAGAPVRLGLALGAGAAKGWAHIGVIKRLEEAGIAPDVVAGTSIGALCGGCYAADRLEALETFARGLTRRRIFGLMDFSWRGSGLISGNKLGAMLERELGSMQIEDTARPFICIATEIETGHEIWLKNGHLATAVRASYALPGVFKPVFFDGMWLLDGAVVNPIPVSVCRAMGARVVIAVNLNTDSFGSGTVIQAPVNNGENGAGAAEADAANTAEQARTAFVHQLFGGPGEGPGITTVLVAAFNISQDRLARSRLAGDPPDVLINPKSPQIGLFDFDKAEESIASGWEAADRALPDIQHAISVLRRHA